MARIRGQQSRRRDRQRTPDPAPVSAAREHFDGGHRLPVTNGYAATPGKGVTIYCGQCSGLYLGTAEWADRYLEAEWGRLSRAAASARRTVTREYAVRKVNETAAIFRQAQLVPTWPVPNA